MLFSLLQIPIEERNDYDLRKILFFLNEKNHLNLIKSEKAKELDPEYIEETFAKNLQLKFLKENETLFSYNDIPDNFYVILKGKINILMPNLIPKIQTNLEYFIYLEELFNQKEYALIKLIIKENKEINTNDIDNIELNNKENKNFKRS